MNEVFNFALKKGLSLYFNKVCLGGSNVVYIGVGKQSCVSNPAHISTYLRTLADLPK